MFTLKRLAQGASVGALLCAISTAAHAQETTSAIHGDVTAAGKPVARASVVAVHTPSGTRATTVTEAGGGFDLRGLRVGGPYTITVTAPGLPPKVRNDVYLEVGQTESLNIDVAAAEVSEVVITGTARRDTEQGPKTTLSEAQIATVVSVNRDPRDLARRDMLVAQDLSGGRLGTNSGGVSIAGSNPRYNRIAVDGVAAQDNFGLAQGGLTTARGPVTLDAIEQFTVAAVPTDVENGDFVGGALNLVLKSGGNDFHGVVFDNYLNDGLVGTKSEDQKIHQAISQKNYGAFLSGPILKDRLFFALSYENYETIDTTQRGVKGSGAPNDFGNNLTQAQIDQVVNFYNSGYSSKFNLGAVTPTKPVTDKKYSAKFDWNITDKHRASFTYRYAESSSIQRTDIGEFTASLDSHWYKQFNSDEAYTVEVNSHWTDRLSTFVKATYRDYNNQQLPPSGQNYSDVSVCLAPTSDGTLTSCATGFDTVRWGPDQFRHANALREQEYRYQAQATYAMDNHTIKVGAQVRQAKPYDIFVPNSRGQYYFDSLADFQAGKASRLQYANAVTGNPNDAAYNSPYWSYSLYLQDTWRISDDLKVAAGLRYDRYSEDDKPILNPNFLARNGFSNQTTIDGLQILMPRVSAVWNPRDNIRITGGFGLFSGGTPDVLTGAPFYNTGYATTNVDIQRTAGGSFIETTNTAGFTQAIGAAALNNLTTDPNFGYQVPTLVQQLQRGTLGGAVTIPATAEVIALSPSFKLPSSYKVFLSGQWRLDGGWTLGADFVASEVNHEITYYDNRAQPLVVNGVQQVLPDGRIRYDGLGAVPGKTSTNLGANRDIIVGNTDEGHSYTVAFTVAKTWDWGGDLLFGYAHQELKDTGGGVFFGTTAGSLYAGVAAGPDPNRDYLGRSVYEIPNRYKLEFSYHHAFFGDNETRVTLFAERQDGRPFGFAMQDRASGRGPVFGVNRQSQLLYVPNFSQTGPSPLDAGLVRFATAGDYANFKRYVDNFNLPQGQLVQKYSNDNAPINRLDLQLSQEFPGFFKDHKVQVNFDVRNLLNLLNSDWGRVAEYSDITTLARADCADANGVIVPTTSAACPRYIYSQVPTQVAKTQNSQLSLWYVQIGLRYKF